MSAEPAASEHTWGPGPPSSAPVSVVARYVVRARRRADLSQRELAQLIGVSQPTIARIETGHLEISASTLIRILAIAELRLTVTDAAGATIEPVSADTVRDHAGRRLPAHLDVGPPDVLTDEKLYSPRYDRPTPIASYHLRQRRDRIRSLSPEAVREALRIGRPDATTDHPTTTDLEHRRQLMRGPQPTIRPAPKPVVECECLVECHEVGPCVGPCPCQCEPKSSLSRFGFAPRTALGRR